MFDEIQNVLFHIFILH